MIKIKTIFEAARYPDFERIAEEIDKLLKVNNDHIIVYTDIVKPEYCSLPHDNVMVRGGEKVITIEFRDMKTYAKFTNKLNKSLTNEKDVSGFGKLIRAKRS